MRLTSIYASTSVVLGVESAGISVTRASDLQLCHYAHTQPQLFQLYRPFSIPWNLSRHLLDRAFFPSRNYDTMVLSDLAKDGLESGIWIDEYNYQNKDKNNITNMFPPFCYCCHLVCHLEYFKTQKTTTIC